MEPSINFILFLIVAQGFFFYRKCYLSFNSKKYLKIIKFVNERHTMRHTVDTLWSTLISWEFWGNSVEEKEFHKLTYYKFIMLFLFALNFIDF